MGYVRVAGHRIALGAVLLMAFVALAVAAALGHGELLLHVDRPLDGWVQAHRSPPATRFFRDVTAVGSSVVTYPGGAVLALLAALRCRPTAALVVVATAARPLVESLLKLGVDRARPDLHPMPAAHGASFPSGHVLGSTVLVLCALTVAALFVGPRMWRALAALGVALLLAVGASRVYLGYHWPTDVLGGWLAGVLFAGLLDAAYRSGKIPGAGRASTSWPAPCSTPATPPHSRAAR